MICVIILRIAGFTVITIIGFDATIVEVGDIAISFMQHYGFQTQVAVWLKTRTSFAGQQWNFI